MNIIYLPHAPSYYLQRMTPGSAGYDLRICSHVTASGTTTSTPPMRYCVNPGEVVTFGTGIRLDIGSELNGGDGSAALCGLVLPRSGLGKQGLHLANTVGLIDADYHGEIMVSLRNVTDYPLHVESGARVAQLVFTLAVFPQFNVVDRFDSASERGDGGFGSTGAA